MKRGLILIDIQNDYFAGGAMELVGMDQAASNSQKLLSYFRSQRLPVFHVQHISTREGATFFLPNTHGCEIHDCVKPQASEPVIVKHYPNSFRETNLEIILKTQNVDGLVICGAMTHMCIDTTTRAAFDLGFNCQVVSDACATRDLVFNGRNISAVDVHSAFMAALSVPFAKVTETNDLIQTG